MSVAVAVTLTLTFGLRYSHLGNIFHEILLVLVPLIFAFANWGSRVSIDALRSKDEARPQPQWPLRLLGLVIGLSFFSAAWIKLATGWLSWSSQDARGYFFMGFLTEGRTSWLAELAATVELPPAWELLDWLTVILEFSILAALPSWRAFRIALAFAALFHLGVLLIITIDFSHNVVVYGAFVSWGVLARSALSSAVLRPAVTYFETRRTPNMRPGMVVFFSLFALAVGAGAWYLMVSPAELTKTVQPNVAATLIIFIGAAIGMAYLGVSGDTWCR
jgi:hypothetical protein